MKVFISQASRDAAHNLDDLSERWQLRKERDNSYSVQIPFKLPTLGTLNEARLFLSELATIRVGLQLECTLNKSRQELHNGILGQINHIQGLQVELKAKIQKMQNEENAREIDIISSLIFKGRLLVHANENEYVLVFPDTKQTVVLPKKSA